MSIKKAALFLLILVVTSSYLFAKVNDQKIWSVQDDAYKAIETLYILEGKALPSATGPWSNAELKQMLAKVARSTNTDLYDYVSNKLYSEHQISVDDVFDMEFTGKFNLAGFYHTNTEFDFPFDDFDNYLFRVQNDKPFFYGDWQTWAGKNFYGYFSAFLRNEPNANSTRFDSFKYNTDLPFFTPDGITTELEQGFPHRAFVAFGSDSWSVELGRDRASWGSGETGNLMLSDTFDYHNQLRFTTFGQKYKYSFMLSFFAAEPNQSNECDTAFFYMAHRMEARFLEDRLSVGITESIMYKNENGIDLRLINPSAFFHNYFIKSKANSIVGLEISYSPVKHLDIYGQFCLDDIASPNEFNDGTSIPNALGYMIGAKTSWVLGKGILNASIEGAFTDPYLYLRSRSGGTQTNEHDTLSFIGHQKTTDYWNHFNSQFVGYTYGGDAIVADAKVSYIIPSKLNIGAEYFFMLHGEKNKHSFFLTGTKEKTPTGLSSITQYLEVKAKYNFNSKYSVFAQYDFATCKQVTDNQVVLGFEATFK